MAYEIKGRRYSKVDGQKLISVNLNITVIIRGQNRGPIMSANLQFNRRKIPGI